MIPLLTVHQLSKRFGDNTALADVSFEVSQGEIVGLIGSNGAGKTTLLECMTGLMGADKGTVSWQGKPLPSVQRKRHLFYLPDNVLPYEERFVVEILTFFRRVFGSVLRKRIGALSKGYRRRFILAIALLSTIPLREAVLMAVLVGVSVMAWRLSGNVSVLNDDPIGGLSPNDFICPVVSYVFLSLYLDMRQPVESSTWMRARAWLTVIVFLVNVFTI